MSLGHISCSFSPNAILGNEDDVTGLQEVAYCRLHPRVASAADAANHICFRLENVSEPFFHFIHDLKIDNGSKVCTYM